MNDAIDRLSAAYKDAVALGRNPAYAAGGHPAISHFYRSVGDAWPAIERALRAASRAHFEGLYRPRDRDLLIPSERLRVALIEIREALDAIGKERT